MYYLLNSRLEIIAESEQNDFDQQGYMIVKADTPALLPKPIVKKLPEQQINDAASGDWDFSKLSTLKKNRLLRWYREEDFERIKSFLNTEKITVLCCSTHKNLITKQIENGIKNGQL